ncbi:FecCD family ABC transporter permease [Sphingomicrobium lutaoense]|uniref:Iron complex transport system permease protein n=1 Tax=Sphingomicrobium lutaoense TaxID=515949 RepID=A0A839Z558_9SPHN|nr:iron ABC transporter permease [Sphingomicrobium lutaoense]MBB3763804.1 iron complex transport system permease protein [Sphingomicrobium lutaoense]
MKQGLAFAALMALALMHLLWPLDVFARVDGEVAELILLELRAPRTLLAISYGAALGITGAALQAIFANPLASPDITGASSGAAFGAVGMAHVVGFTAPLAMAAGGAFGAGGALLLLFLIAGRGADPARLLLAGLAIALAAGAATSLLLALAPSPYAFYDMWRWLMGSLVERSWTQAIAALVPAALACLWIWKDRMAFDLMALGGDVAASMGVDPARLARRTMVLSAVAIGACVSVAGAIGFVGLIAPIAARSLMKGHPGKAIGLAGMLGAFTLVAADILVRFAPEGRPIPVGVITALVGTPLFVMILLSLRPRSVA